MRLKSRVPRGPSCGQTTLAFMLLGILVGFRSASASNTYDVMSSVMSVDAEQHAVQAGYGCADYLIPLWPEPAEVIAIEVVTDVSSSGDMLWLGKSSGGRPLVAITDATIFQWANGSRASINELEPGMCIQILGQVGKPGEVLAERIVILRQVPTWLTNVI